MKAARGSRHRGGADGELAQTLVAATDRTSHKLRRDVGLVGLVLASLSSIIGAGWLFASALAGPAAIISC
jgi:hypothetical protein